MHQPNNSSFIDIFHGADLGKLLLRLVVFGSYFSLLFTFLLGIVFGLLIFPGIYFIIIKLALFWKPAYQIFAKIGGLREQEFKPMKIHPVSIFSNIISIGTYAAMIGVGIWMLFHLGFLHQNLIYVLLFHRS